MVMARSIYKHYTHKYRKVIVTYMTWLDGNFHHKTFKDCTLIEASNVYKAMSRVFNWFYIGYSVVDY